MLTIGKPIASEIPAAAYGFSQALARRLEERATEEQADVGGIGRHAGRKRLAGRDAGDFGGGAHRGGV